jgi:hypothetical protein
VTNNNAIPKAVNQLGAEESFASVNADTFENIAIIFLSLRF